MQASQQRGFTLIELVVVITILGILAAFAIPKFITLDTQARVATVNGLGATVRSAAALARGLAMATGGNPATVPMEGTAVSLSNNYPDASATGIAAAINTSGATDFAFATTGATGTATWTKVGAPTPANCSVSYTAAAAGATPTIAFPGALAGC